MRTTLLIRALLLLCLAACLHAPPASAQARPYTPAPGSAERRAILDAARKLLEEELGQPVRFRVGHLRVQAGWAFLAAEPERRDGRPFDYRGTPYEAAVEAGAFDEMVHALLRRGSGGWKVVALDLGATDVVWEPWPEEHRAPRGIFPSW